MDFAIGTVGFWAIGYTPSCTEFYWFFIGNPSIDSVKTCTVCFFKLYLLQLLPRQLYQRQSPKEQIFNIPYLFFDDDRFHISISGHWVWQGEGWLTNLGFIDFAGSTVVHSVGGWATLVAAVMVGPRIGKYTDGDESGHNLMLGSLGVLYFG
jgi:Amt family ammonium transporter